MTSPSLRTRDDLARFLLDHPTMKKRLREGRGRRRGEPQRRRPSRPSGGRRVQLPPEVRESMGEDREALELLSLARTVMEYYRAFTSLQSRSLEGEAVGRGEIRSFQRRWRRIGEQYQAMMRMTAARALDSPVIAATAEIIAEEPGELWPFADPALESTELKPLLDAVGLRSEEVREWYEQTLLPDRDGLLEDLGSGAFETYLQNVEETAHRIDFPFDPANLEADGRLTLGGDFFVAVGGFLGSIFAAVATAVVAVIVVQTVVAAAVAATVAVASAAVRTGEWIDRQALHVDADRWDIKPGRFPDPDNEDADGPILPQPKYPPECEACEKTAIKGPASAADSFLELARTTITDEESTLVRAVVRDAAGCCMVNQTVEFSVDQGLFPDRLLPSQRRAGEYVATFFGSEYSGPIPGTVRIGLEVNGEIGPIVQLQIETAAGGSASLTGSSGDSGDSEPEPGAEPECTTSEDAGPADPAQMVLQADKTKLASGESAEILAVLRDAEGHCTESSTARLGVLGAGNQLVGGVQLVQQGNGRYRGVFSFGASWAEVPRVGLVIIVDSATMSEQVLMIEQA